MEQVPKIKYGLVGSGRVATHLSYYFKLLDIPILRWSRRDELSLEQALVDCDDVLLAIPDSKIESFLSEHPALNKKTIIHFSGALVIPGTQSAHPLMTFGLEFYDLKNYSEIPFVTELGKKPFKDLFPELPNPSVAIEGSKKPLYHALCVMSGNFTMLLWNKFFRELAALGFDESLALPYMKQVFHNLESMRPGILTGPLARRDHLTLDANIAALVGDPYQEIFKSFVRAEVST